MSPKNNFEGFFSGKDLPEVQKYAPTPIEIMEALMLLAGKHEFFYKDAKMRLIVATNVNYLTNWMVTEKDAGRPIPLHVGHAAFMMMLAQVMEMSYEEYAGDEEREAFPMGDDVEEDDSDF